MDTQTKQQIDDLIKVGEKLNKQLDSLSTSLHKMWNKVDEYREKVEDIEIKTK